jgi:hypothetical protein
VNAIIMAMNTCSIETGLLRKKPCGNAAVASCVNCEQQLCVEHAVAQLSEAGKRTGKFICKECAAAAKEYDKSMAGVAKSQDAKKMAAIDKTVRNQVVASATPKKPVAGEPAPAEQPKGPDVIEFTPTPKDGKS